MAMAGDWLGYFGLDGQPIGEAEAAALYASDDRVVARTHLRDGTLVSTVWLGIDHGHGDGPLIFETMVFPHPAASMIDADCRRYATAQEAVAGHDETVAAWASRSPVARDWRGPAAGARS